VTACDKVTIDYESPPLFTHEKDVKPPTPVPLGTIRAYFGEYYKSFTQQAERVQPVDSISNLYMYGEYKGIHMNHIRMIRCDSELVLETYIEGYSLDSLPLNQPLPEVYGKYPQIILHPFGQSDWGDPSFYSLAYYLRKCNFIITDKTDDILTGTFDGMLESSTGNLLPITEGEFKIKVFRKEMSISQNE
jgi:hypothetical protein